MVVWGAAGGVDTGSVPADIGTVAVVVAGIGVVGTGGKVPVEAEGERSRSPYWLSGEGAILFITVVLSSLSWRAMCGTQVRDADRGECLSELELCC